MGYFLSYKRRVVVTGRRSWHSSSIGGFRLNMRRRWFAVHRWLRVRFFYLIRLFLLCRWNKSLYEKASELLKKGTRNGSDDINSSSSGNSRKGSSVKKRRILAAFHQLGRVGGSRNRNSTGDGSVGKYNSIKSSNEYYYYYYSSNSFYSEAISDCLEYIKMSSLSSSSDDEKLHAASPIYSIYNMDI